MSETERIKLAQSIQCVLSELEYINTVTLAARGLSAEANHVGQARVMLDQWMGSLQPEGDCKTTTEESPGQVSHSKNCSAWTMGLNGKQKACDCGASPPNSVSSQSADQQLYDDSDPVMAALSLVADDGDATDNQRRAARMAMKEIKNLRHIAGTWNTMLNKRHFPNPSADAGEVARAIVRANCHEAALLDVDEAIVRYIPHLVRDISAALTTTRQQADDYVAWCRYTYDEGGGIKTIVTCDSDAKGAFKVYRGSEERRGR